MSSSSELQTPLERQLLLQLGGRLRAARKLRRLSSAKLALEVGISRTTLHAVESGEGSPSMATYVRVLSTLGMCADLALVGTGEATITSRRPSVPRDSHIPQDLQSLLMHEEAVRLLKGDPSLLARAKSTLARWRESGDSRTWPLWDEWKRILEVRDWKLALQKSERGNQLRQASPLTTLLPNETRMSIIRKVRAMKESEHATA